MIHVPGNWGKKEESKLSKHNYTQYSNKKSVEVDEHVENVSTVVEPIVEPAVTATPVVPVEPVMAEETVETVTLPKMVHGVVANCSKLNVRENATMSSNIVCVLDAATEIEVNVARSTGDWLYICTAAGIEGYCMRKFVNANL